MQTLRTIFGKWCYQSPASGLLGGKTAFYNPRVDAIYLPAFDKINKKNNHPFYAFEQVHRVLASTRFRCFMRLIAALAYHCIQGLMEGKNKEKEDYVTMLNDLNEMLEDLHNASFLTEEIFSLAFTIKAVRSMDSMTEGKTSELEKNALLVDYIENESFEELYSFYKHFWESADFEFWYFWLVTDALNSKSLLFYIPAGLNPTAISAAKRQIKEILKTISPDELFRRNIRILGTSSILNLGSLFPLKKEGEKIFLKRHKCNPLNFWCRQDKTYCLWRSSPVKKLMLNFKVASILSASSFSDLICRMQTKGMSSMMYHPLPQLDIDRIDKADFYLSTASHVFTEEGKIYYNSKTKSRSDQLLFWEMINLQIHQREGLECPLLEINKCNTEMPCRWKNILKRFYEETKDIYSWEKPSCLKA